MSVTLTDILEARERIRSGIYESPCPESIPLSEVTGCQIYCKLDYLQRTGSFKERGARNALMLLAPDVRSRGVICASAGNHALGVTHHGRLLGIGVTVVMPRHAPLTKINNCRALGASVILQGDTFDEAQNHAKQLADEKGFGYINGFDDPAVIAGQGTMGLEILEQVPDVEAILVPVGGGGLIAGIAIAARSIRPEVKILGIEPTHAACFAAARQAGTPVSIKVLPTLADGLAVSKVGETAFRLANPLVDAILDVDEAFIAKAILRLMELEKSVVEGAGASGLAALLSGLCPELTDKKVVLPLCGGNIDTPVIGRIIERGLVADGRLVRFHARISDRPGGLARFAAVVAEEDASVQEIDHDRAFAGGDLNSVILHCLVETRDHDHIGRLKERLAREGFLNTGFSGD